MNVCPVILRRAEESALTRKNKIGAIRLKILRALPSRMTSCVILQNGQADPVPTVGDGAFDVPSFAFCSFIPFVILRRAEESALIRKNKIGAIRLKILRALPSRMTE